MGENVRREAPPVWRLVPAAALAAILGLAAGAAQADDDAEAAAQERIAQAIDIAFGIGVISDYIDGGESLSDGKPSLDAFVEPRFGIFYVGAGIATVRLTGDDDDDDDDDDGDVAALALAPGETSNLEARLYAGIRPSIGPVNFDIGIERKIYDRLAEENGTSAHIEAEFELIERVELELEAEYGFDEREWEVEAGLGFEVLENLTLKASIGHEFDERVTFWGVGATYDFNDRLSGSLAYVGADNGLSTVVVGLSVKASLAQLRGAGPADDD